MHTETSVQQLTVIRERFVADHDRLEELVELLLAAIETDDPESILRLLRATCEFSCKSIALFANV